MKRWLALLPLALFIVIVGVSLSRLTSAKPAPATFSSPERPVPHTQAATLTGGQLDFSRLKGPVIVNFWATWCTPCRAEHPLLVNLKSQGVAIIGVLHKDATDKAKTLLAQDGDPFKEIALDPDGDLSLSFGISGVPESFLIDAKGVIVKTVRGPLVGTEGDAFLAAYRAEIAKSPAG